MGSSTVNAQVTLNFSATVQPETEGIELLQAEPYDLVRFKASAGGGWAKVKLFDFPGRTKPQKTSGTLPMVIEGLPGKTYEAKWADIEAIELWEERLTAEANERMKRGDFSSAYPFIAVLYRDNPGVERFELMRKEYLLNNAVSDFRGGDLRRTLAILEELRRFAPEYQPEVVLKAIGGVTDRVMAQMLESGKLQDAQRLLARLENDYQPSEVSSIVTWNQKFLSMAEEKRDQAVVARDAKDWRTAKRLAMDSKYLYPRILGGDDLIREIDQAYPLVNVGVLQSATELDPTRIDNWPARRTGRLVYRSLFEMQGAGSSGGEYEFLFGETSQSPDRLVLQLEMRPGRVQGPLAMVDSFTLGDRLTAMTSRSSETYKPVWAASLDSLAVPNPTSVGVYMKRPHVRPESLLQVIVDGSWAGLPPGSPTGDYTLAPDGDNEKELRFVLNKPPVDGDGRPREIVEIRQDDAGKAVEALVRGELDVLDHIFPADAIKLRNQPNIRVGQYPLPTVHMLIPISDNPYLAERDFRRGIIYGINRNDVLNELLGNAKIPGCKVISGPFPAGKDKDDPLNYAYDESIQPFGYEPRLAALFKAMVAQQLKDRAIKDKETPPELKPLKLAYPQDDMARIACQAIAQQLTMIGIEIELIELPTGVSRPEKQGCDLLYAVVALWEPISDARRVLGPEGLARSTNQFIGLGLRRLEQAIEWRVVSEQLKELHRIAHYELPVIPLWQMVDSYAYRPTVGGLSADVVTLYEDVDRWRLNR
jgi:hypothetical protein